VRGAELIIHNAPFDIGFLNAELALLDRAPIETICHAVLDSLRMAKELHPGKRNSLDALCERYGVDDSKRTLHGALLDAELLAEVYLAMTRGQESLVMENDQDKSGLWETVASLPLQGTARQTRLILRATDPELAEHERLLASIQKESKGKCLWLADKTSA
jgi:DNA polymerase-3 subunit epsilon